MSFNIIYAEGISSNINSIISEELQKNNFPTLDRSVENVNSSGFFRWPRSNPFCSLKYFFNTDHSVAIIATNFKSGQVVKLLFKPTAQRPADVRSLWDLATPMTALHPYLREKGFTLEDLQPIITSSSFFGFKVDEKKNLLVPYTTHAGALEWIEVRGEGGFRGARGSKKEGLFRLNEHFDGGEDVYLCEGPATALSLAVELRSPVYGCGSRIQMISAARSLKERFEGASIIACLDMDKPHEVMQLQSVLEAMGVATYLPLPQFSREDGFDFNDLMQWERAHG